MSWASSHLIWLASAVTRYFLKPSDWALTALPSAVRAAIRRPRKITIKPGGHAATQQDRGRRDREAGAGPEAEQGPGATKAKARPEPTTMSPPSPVQVPRCAAGDRRNQPRRTTSSYISPWTRCRVGLKVFFRLDRVRVGSVAKTPGEQCLLVGQQRGAGLLGGRGGAGQPPVLAAQEAALLLGDGQVTPGGEVDEGGRHVDRVGLLVDDRADQARLDALRRGELDRHRARCGP